MAPNALVCYIGRHNDDSAISAADELKHDLRGTIKKEEISDPSDPRAALVSWELEGGGNHIYKFSKSSLVTATTLSVKKNVFFYFAKLALNRWYLISIQTNCICKLAVCFSSLLHPETVII